MKLSGNTILVTGGSSGIGLEISKQLLQKSNKVIICGRSQKKLDEAKKLNPELIVYQCDISQKEQINELVNKIESEHPDINVLINNAAIVHKTSFVDNPEILRLAEEETATNFLGPVRLIKKLLPVLNNNDKPCIVNVTTGLVYIPRTIYPFYNATKAALHSFTQGLRFQIDNSKTEIIEVMFPAVDTAWHKGDPPKIAISPKIAVDAMFKGIKKNRSEIRIGKAKLLYRISRIAPAFALKKVNSL